MKSKKVSSVSTSFLRKSAVFLQEVKSYIYQLIIAEKARTILDIGCGPGIDTVELAMKMKSPSQIWGIDKDAEMINQANIWAFSNRVETKTKHIRANANQLPFADSFFDVIRSERLFQHIQDGNQRDQVFQESLRVLKPGGLAITADTDWTSLRLDFPNIEMERKMVQFLTEQIITNGYIGKQLPKMYQQAGLKEVIIQKIPIHFYELKFTPVGEFLVKKAEEARLFPQQALNEWLEILKEKDRKKDFACSIDMVVVSGRKE